MLNLIYSLADQNFTTTKSLGILNFSIQLAEAFAHRRSFNDLTLLSNSTIRCNIPKGAAQILNCDFAIANKLARVFWDQWAVYKATPLIADDWLFLPKGFASFARKPPCRLAAYIQDTMIDYYRTRYPGRMSAFESWYFNASLKATFRQADIIFTNLECTRLELLRFAESQGCTPPPIAVAGIGFHPPLTAPRAKKNQIVFLASKWPHKLTSLAIKYADRWQRQTDYEGNVLWIGSMPEDSPLPNHPRWQQYPRLEESQFRTIVEESKALVFFSDYEGFGMPPVEATLCQTSPVFSDIPATREVMQGMGFAFKNDDYESFASAMEQALHAREGLLVGWREALLKMHSWENVVQMITSSLCSLSAQAPNT